MTLDDLRGHSFVRLAMTDAFTIHELLRTGSIATADASFSRDPDEHEFYQLRVGRAIAELLASCEQISQALTYLAYSPSPRLRREGITSHAHILYHFENHAIRIHSLYDRSLQLVDAVFHLLNAANEISHKVVAGNLKVARTDIPARLKALRAVLAPTFDVRHEIIHRESFKDDALRKLEMYCVVGGFASEDDQGPLKLSRVKARERELAREVVRDRRRDLGAMNARLYEATHELFSKLEPLYKREKAALARRVE